MNPGDDEHYHRKTCVHGPVNHTVFHIEPEPREIDHLGDGHATDEDAGKTGQGQDVEDIFQPLLSADFSEQLLGGHLDPCPVQKHVKDKQHAYDESGNLMEPQAEKGPFIHE